MLLAQFNLEVINLLFEFNLFYSFIIFNLKLLNKLQNFDLLNFENQNKE